ncbi:MAG: PilZ domain-containing protein [Syntrophobacterales bacterium]
MAEVDCEEKLLMGAMKDRRSHPRTAVDWPAMVITPGACIGGEIKNLSASGAFFHCFTEPDRGQPLRLVFRDPNRKKLLVVTAELAWSNIANTDDISSCGIGIQFTNTLSYEQLFPHTRTSEHLQATA